MKTDQFLFSNKTSPTNLDSEFNRNNHHNKPKIIIGIIIILLLAIGSFLLFFKSQPVEYYLVLTGDADMVIYQHTDYIDPGYEAYDNQGNNFYQDVVIDGAVNPEIAGEYIIKYRYKNLEQERHVTVISKNDSLTFLVLQGDRTIYLQTGATYIEPGYDVIDSVDTNLREQVTIEGHIDTTTPGTYKLLYSVTNFYGETFTAERTIIVVSLDYHLSLEDNSKFVKENNIIFTTTDNNYSYLLLPNGTKASQQKVSYKITNNGEYTFRIYNQVGFFEEKKITINNIDKTSPTGTCIGIMYDNDTKLSVTAKDDTEISFYEYLYGNNTSGKTTTTTYQYTNNINTAKVNIYDSVNNQTTITCQLSDKSTATPTSYKSYNYQDSETSRTMNYWLYIPDNLTVRNNVPLVVYMHGDGGRGTNIKLVNNHAFPKFVARGEKYPFMLLAPQISNETNWTDEKTYKTLMNLIKKITTSYNVNPKKIILSGGSSGGGGVYVITAAYPNFFSCAVIGSGIYDSAYRKIAHNLINTPMWIFHGTKDASISHNGVKSLAEYINSIGGNVKFVSIEGGTHGVTETIKGFRNPELINWMISQEN